MMKRAIGMAVLGFLSIFACWGLMEFVWSQFNRDVFLQNISHPVYFFGCYAAAVAYGAHTFLKERKKAAQTVTIAIR